MSKHIMITGAGRSGTTLLIRLLWAMGEEVTVDPLPDFYPPEAYPDFHHQTEQEDRLRAGKEWPIDPGQARLEIDYAPRVIKSPAYVTWMQHVMDKLEHVIIPIRDAKLVAKSRYSVGLANWSGTAFNEENVVYWAIGKAVYHCEMAGVPYTFVSFSDLLHEHERAFHHIRSIFGWELNRLADWKLECRLVIDRPKFGAA